MTTQTGPQPAGFTDVRSTNLAVVLRHIRTASPCSRADIAASTGLNKATVSSLVADLIERRLVRETGLTQNRIGRPATMLTVDGGGYAAVGMEVCADHLSVVAIDMSGTELVSWHRAFPALSCSPAKAVSAIAALAGRAVARIAAQGRRPLGLTLGVPGLVDGDGVVRLATGLGWRDVDLRADLTRALRDPGYEVTVDTSANLAAVAEYRNGPHAGAGTLVHLTGDVSIGAGLMLDGRLVRGARGFAGDLGHLQLDPAGPLCPCGRRGCLESLAGIRAIITRVLPDAEDDGPIIDFTPEIDRVLALARQGDKKTVDALADVGRHLGHGVSFLTSLVNPEVALLGGAFIPLAPWLLPTAEAELIARTVAPDAGGCRLMASALGPGATAVGAAVCALAAIEDGLLPSVA